MDTNALSDTGVWLFCFNTNLLDNDARGVGGSSERLSPFGSLMGLLIALVSPAIESSLDAQLATGIDSAWFVTSHFKSLDVLISIVNDKQNSVLILTGF